MPEVVNTLLDVSQLRYLCNREGISQVSHRGDNLVMRLDSNYVKDPLMLLTTLRETDTRLQLVEKPYPAITMKFPGIKDRELLVQSLRLMRVLSERMDAKRHAQAEQAAASSPEE
jgi:transcription-repair coupling factor (superfamily II helicase)